MNIVDYGWGIHHEVDAGAVFGEGDDVANVVDGFKDHEDTIETGGAAGVWGSTILESAEHTAKARFDVFVVVAENVEDFVHDVWVIVADGARTDFVTVHNHVVLVGNESELIGIGSGLLKCG